MSKVNKPMPKSIVDQIKPGHGLRHRHPNRRQRRAADKEMRKNLKNNRPAPANENDDQSNFTADES